MKIVSSKSTRQPPQKPEKVKPQPKPKKDKPKKVVTAHEAAPAAENTKKRGKAKKKRKKGKGIIITVCILALLAGLYFFAVYTQIPAIKNLRDAYIETAMTTMNHQWLAKAFFPQSVIDDVMSRVYTASTDQDGIESKWEHKETEKKDRNANFYELFDEIDRESLEQYLKDNPNEDRISLMQLDINEAGINDDGTSIKTKQGDQVLAINARQGVLLVRVEGSTYQGVLAIMKDPAKFRCCIAEHIGSYGELLEDFVPRCDGILGFNASGFYDAEGSGSGGVVDGYTMCSGEEYGRHTAYGRKRVEMRTDNKMYIVDADSSISSDVRDAVEFQPALIIDGVSLIDQQSGFRSIQPRTSIGQTRDGDILAIVIEGRLPGRSLGTGLPEVTGILERYGAYQAMNMDGGTSAVMWYDGEYVTKCSNPAIRCRYLPNAWIYGSAK